MAKLNQYQITYLEKRVGALVESSRSRVSDKLRPLRDEIAEQVVEDLGLNAMAETVQKALNEALELNSQFQTVSGEEYFNTSYLRTRSPKALRWEDLPNVKELVKREVERRLQGTELHDIESKLKDIRLAFTDKVYLSGTAPEISEIAAKVQEAMAPFDAKIAQIEAKSDKKSTKRIARSTR